MKMDFYRPKWQRPETIEPLLVNANTVTVLVHGNRFMVKKQVYGKFESFRDGIQGNNEVFFPMILWVASKDMEISNIKGVRVCET